MENENKQRRKLKISFFDILIMIIVIVLAGGFVVCRAGGGLDFNKKSSDSTETQITYTVEITDLDPSTKDLIHKGDLLIDKVKKYELGNVKKVETYPFERMTNDKINKKFVNTPDPERISALLTVKVNGSETETALTADSGFEIRVGEGVSLVGPGYVGAGYITSIERTDD